MNGRTVQSLEEDHSSVYPSQYHAITKGGIYSLFTAAVTTFVLPATTRDIGEQLSHQHAAQKVNNRQALLQIVSSIRFLSRQGLAMRGDGDESDGNLNQLLRMKAEGDPNLAEWLKSKENVYTSPDIQNEILIVMGLPPNTARNCHRAPEFPLHHCDG